jgi:hypothetical protein
VIDNVVARAHTHTHTHTYHKQITSRTGFNLSSTFVSMYLRDRSIAVKSRTRVAYLTARAEESNDTHKHTYTHTTRCCTRTVAIWHTVLNCSQPPQKTFGILLTLLSLPFFSPPSNKFVPPTSSYKLLVQYGMHTVLLRYVRMSVCPYTS